jgi:hypothetical protein
MDNKKFKKIICNNWINNDCKFMKEKERCNFAHGNEDIIKVDCRNYANCFNEECKFIHHPNWNPYDNKNDCLICLDPKKICNKENKKYKHINDIKEVIKKDISKIPEDDDFPELVKTKEKETKNDNINIDKINYTYSEILTSKIKSDLNINPKRDINNEIIEIKNELKKKYICLKGLNPNDWADCDEIDDIEHEIIKLKNRYNKIKNEGKKDNIFDDNLNLNIIFMENDKNENINNNVLDVIPDIKLTINGILCDNIEEITIKTNNENQEKNDNVEILIDNMEKQINKYIETIKEYIINTVKDDYLKYMFINNLNEITFNIIKLKNDYKDVINN